jgi:hypothetical protein
VRLKRLYRQPLTNPPIVRGVTVLESDPTQNFSPRLIEKGVSEGWLTMERGKVIVRGDNQTLTYRIVLPPGYYCCHCNRALDDSRAAEAHVAERHQGTPSPDRNNPSGYRKDSFFACELEN